MLVGMPNGMLDGMLIWLDDMFMAACWTTCILAWLNGMLNDMPSCMSKWYAHRGSGMLDVVLGDMHDGMVDGMTDGMFDSVDGNMLGSMLNDMFDGMLDGVLCTHPRVLHMISGQRDPGLPHLPPAVAMGSVELSV